LDEELMEWSVSPRDSVVMIVILAKVLVSKVAYIVHEFYESAKTPLGFNAKLQR